MPEHAPKVNLVEDQSERNQALESWHQLGLAAAALAAYPELEDADSRLELSTAPTQIRVDQLASDNEGLVPVSVGRSKAETVEV